MNSNQTTMQPQKLFTHNFIHKLRRNLAKNKGLESYSKKEFKFEAADVLINPRIQVPDLINPILPKGKENFDFENAKIIFESYKSLTPTQATDVRMWAYLAHTSLWDYMKKRFPIEKQPLKKRGEYVLEHWFIDGVSPRNLVRHGISLLWWGAYLTYDSDRKDHYELTRELFSMLDYTRTLISGTQGRNKNFSHALLEFVRENGDLFAQYKEGRVRFLMTRANYLGGYKILPDLSKKEIKEIFKKYTKEIQEIKI